MNALKWPKCFNIVPKWQIFAKSGHTVFELNRERKGDKRHASGIFCDLCTQSTKNILQFIATGCHSFTNFNEPLIFSTIYLSNVIITTYLPIPS